LFGPFSPIGEPVPVVRPERIEIMLSERKEKKSNLKNIIKRKERKKRCVSDLISTWADWKNA
jgi:hypothetical protein